MIKKIDKNEERKNRHKRVRSKVSGTAEMPRLNVYRSLNGIYAQVIDDVAGNTLVSCSSIDKDIAEKLANMDKKAVAKFVGQKLGEKALSKGITNVVFDRGGYLYTGRVASLAEGAREAGLKF